MTMLASYSRVGQQRYARWQIDLQLTNFDGILPPARTLVGQTWLRVLTANVRSTMESRCDFEFFSDRDAKEGAEMVEWTSANLS